jgi:hypothetical protein
LGSPNDAELAPSRRSVACRRISNAPRGWLPGPYRGSPGRRPGPGGWFPTRHDPGRSSGLNEKDPPKMGLLNLFSKGARDHLVRLPSGSFTVDATGKIITSTIPQSFPEALLKQLGDTVLNIFRQAQEAQNPLSDLTFQYAALKVTARELRGGAIIFLSPKALAPK